MPVCHPKIVQNRAKTRRKKVKEEFGDQKPRNEHFLNEKGSNKENVQKKNRCFLCAKFAASLHTGGKKKKRSVRATRAQE